MSWYDILGYCIAWGALILLPFVAYKLFRTSPRHRAKTDVAVEPVVSQYDLPFVETMMALVRQHESTHVIQPRLRVVSADHYIVETTNASGGRNTMPFSEMHDLRTREGLRSFEDSCQYGLIQSLYFLAGTNPKQRAPIYKSKNQDEFHREDLEPWMSVLDIIRKRNGHL